MAHSLSAKKRIRQNENANARNRWRKRRVKGDVKEFLDAVQSGNVEQAETAYRTLTKSIDQVAAKGTIHKRTAARSKSRLAARLNALKAEQASA